MQKYEADPEKLKQKLGDMPYITTKQRVITSKTGTKFLVTETVITTWTSFPFIEAMVKSHEEKATPADQTRKNSLF